MFLLSAFADEISPDPLEQISVLRECHVRFIELRSIYSTNVLRLTDDQIREFKKMIHDAGIGLSAIGSPVGKVPLDHDFPTHLNLLNRAIELCSVFDCPRIRIFSFYPPESGWNDDWQPHRAEVLDRLRQMAEVASAAKVTLIHENEHRIYGDSPERVRDIMVSVNDQALTAAYDAANWVFCGYDPVQGWEQTKEFTTHLHIKDWKKRLPGDESHGHGVLAGTGDGQISHSIRDAVARGYQGFAVMEPHLRGGGPTGGVTGPDLFPVAVQYFRTILQSCHGTEG